MPPRRKAKVIVEYDDIPTPSSSSMPPPPLPPPPPPHVGTTPSGDRMWTFYGDGNVKTEFLAPDIGTLPSAPHEASYAEMEEVLQSLEGLVSDNPPGVDDFGDLSFAPDIDWDEDGLPVADPEPSAPTVRTTVSDDPEDEDTDDSDSNTAGDNRKRKRYASSDDPLTPWRAMILKFLAETFLFHSLGVGLLDSECVSCGRNFDCRTPSTLEDNSTLYRCTLCGPFVECLSCCKDRHMRTPIHAIQRWSGEYWKTYSLAQMGAVYQLNHFGSPCNNPEPTLRTLTVLDISGVHTIVHTRCACRRAEGIQAWQQYMRQGWYPASFKNTRTCATFSCLDLLRRLKVIATVNVRDFMTVVEDTTDPFATIDIADRYKALLLMIRQWSFLQRVRRAGLGMDGRTLEEARPGALAVPCWTCPRPGINLPSGWQHSNTPYIFNSIYSIDANFRQSSKYRPSPRMDKPLFDGLGVQVPWDFYHRWLRHYIKEEEWSSCVAFAALMQKDTKFSTGLRWAGVLGIICARHELMHGLGDLEKGERYKNTDAVLWWVLSRLTHRMLAFTYDIACQYKINFKKRIVAVQEFIQSQLDALPPALCELRHPALTLPEIDDIVWALPVWHGNVHECEAENSVKYQYGLGKTDGEGIERIWAMMNPMSYTLKEEGPGLRHDDIEDLVNRINYRKNIQQGHTLLRRLRIAIEERNKQIVAFFLVDSTLEKDLRDDWMRMKLDWEKDKTKPNPYSPAKGVKQLSEKAVREKLREEELDDHETDITEASEASTASKKKTRGRASTITAGAFLVMGCELQLSQRKIHEIKNSKTKLTPTSTSVLKERRQAVLSKLADFRRHQARFMPGVNELLEEEQDQRRVDRIAEPEPEDVKLYMPSTCPLDLAVSESLCRKEAALRRGQCSDCVSIIRGRLIAQRHLISFRNANAAGQWRTTRTAHLMATISEKLNDAVSRYEIFQASLQALEGERGCLPFRVLLRKDVELYSSAEVDVASVRKLGRASSGRNSRVTSTGGGKDTMHWLWTADGGPTGDDGDALREAVRLEWTKALARKERWEEEVLILQEEMRRVLRSLKHGIEEWRQRAANVDSTLDPALQEGYKAYALKTAASLNDLQASFMMLWSKEGPARGQKEGPADATTQRVASALVSEVGKEDDSTAVV